MRFEGSISNDNLLRVSGYICKAEVKVQVDFVIDTGFADGLDVAIPADIAASLNLEADRVVPASTASGPTKLPSGKGLKVCLGGRELEASYVITRTANPLISVNFLRKLSELVIIDFEKRYVMVMLR